MLRGYVLFFPHMAECPSCQPMMISLSSRVEDDDALETIVAISPRYARHHISQQQECFNL